MKRQTVFGALILAAEMLSGAGAVAGPWEDGMAAYNRSDYVPALHLFRPLAARGNAKAQSMLGTMYRRGQGVAQNPRKAFVWLKLAAARGDVPAKAQLRDVSKSMTPEELSRARELAEACEASDYRSCEY